MAYGATLDRETAARLLGIPADAESREVRRAFRLWATMAHPDIGGSQEQFARLCAARDVLLASPVPSAPQDHNSAAESGRLAARTPWRDVLRTPSPMQALMLFVLLTLSVSAVLAALVVPVLLGLAVAAIAATAASVAIARALLRNPDHGHLIVTRTIAWMVITGLQCVVAALAGIPAFEALPLLAVPFVASIAMINPGAGMWRANVR